MEIETQSVQSSKLQTIDKIRRNFNFMKFSLLPEFADFKNDLRWMSAKVGISIEDALNFQEELFAVGIWIKDSNGSVATAEKFVNYFPENEGNKKVLGFLTANANLASKVTNDGPCWYEYSTVITTPELRNQFVQKVNAVYQEFISKSQEAKGTEMLSWSHMFMDALAAGQQEEQ